MSKLDRFCLKYRRSIKMDLKRQDKKLKSDQAKGPFVYRVRDHAVTYCTFATYNYL